MQSREFGSFARTAVILFQFALVEFAPAKTTLELRKRQ